MIVQCLPVLKNCSERLVQCASTAKPPRFKEISILQFYVSFESYEGGFVRATSCASADVKMQTKTAYAVGAAAPDQISFLRLATPLLRAIYFESFNRSVTPIFAITRSR